MNTKLAKYFAGKGMSASAVARLIGTSRQNVNNHLSGRNKPGYDMIKEYLKIGIPLDVFDDETGKNEE